MDSDKLLNLATSLGCLLAESGAEISRVEESVYRLLQAYQGKDAQVFAIPSCLIVSLMAEDGRPVTRMRRISAHGTDLELLERWGADAIRERAESAALLEKRDGLLRCKQQLIREALGQVCQELEQAPAQEYFSLLLELVGRWAQPGDGVLYLNARDLQRLPQGFQEELERIAPQGKIALSPQPRQLESGFVLAYGPVELDCTFPALFQEAYDQLRDAAGAILFAPAGAKEEP